MQSKFNTNRPFPFLCERRQRDECDMDLDPDSDTGESPWNSDDDFALSDEQNAESEWNEHEDEEDIELYLLLHITHTKWRPTLRANVARWRLRFRCRLSRISTVYAKMQICQKFGPLPNPGFFSILILISLFESPEGSPC